jgi:hypothetical protein
MDYLREYKLIRTAQILRTTDKSILDIALDFKYSNPENFTRAFKARYGVPPSEYRERNKNNPLIWKDNSTGTVIKRFESEFPNLERIDIDIFTDYLYTVNPIKYAFNIFFASQIDCAVYKLSDDNEYIYIEEYCAEETAMTLFCKDDDIDQYIRIAKKFTDSFISILCDINKAEPSDNYGYLYKRVHYDYAYLLASIDVYVPQDYSFRALEETDYAAIEKFSRKSKSIVLRVFEQRKKYGNSDGTLFFGLFYKSALVGCAMPCVESGKGISNCDIGGIFMLEEYKSELALTYFWSSIIEFCIKNDLISTNSGTSKESGIINCAASEKLGYTCVAKRLFFSDYQA